MVINDNLVQLFVKEEEQEAGMLQLNSESEKVVYAIIAIC